MRKIFVHNQFSNLKDDIEKYINNFENEDDNILEGERNIIKSTEIGKIELNVKQFKKPHFFNAFVYKYLRKSKARRSFEYALRLIDANILTPFPVAYVEESSIFGLKSSYYISKQVNYDLDFRVLIHDLNYPNRERILQEFTKFTFKLHENDVNFLDHSPGNTLIVNKGGNEYDFYLIDLNRMKFEVMDFDKRMHNFRRLWISKAMLKIMAKTYAELYPKTYQEVHSLMLRHSRAFQKKIDSKKLRRAGRKLKFKS